MKLRLALLPALLLAFAPATRAADQLFVEAENFASSGGWSLDTQFIDIMGSPYLIAHGLGQPVKDATTSVTFPAAVVSQTTAPMVAEEVRTCDGP